MFKRPRVSVAGASCVPSLLFSSLCGTWVMAEEVARLSPVVISTTATERALNDAPASITVITQDELARRPVQDLADALQGQPGINIGGVGLTRRGIGIRGMSSEYTLTLIDGRRINQTSGLIGHSDIDLGWVPPEAIERIEVVRGPMSSLYGSDALGGVVNMITRSATDRWRGSASVGGGWRDDGRGGQTHQGAFYVGGPLVQGKLGLSVYGENRRRSATPGDPDSNISQLEGRESTTGNVALSFTPDSRQRIDATFGRGDEDRWRNARQAGSRPYLYETRDNIKREQWSVSHRGRWDWGETQLRAYGSSIDKTNSRTQGDITRPQSLQERIVDGRATFGLGRMHLISVGGEWRKESLEDSSVNAVGHKQADHQALFLQDEIAFSPAWSLVLGNRIDRHEQFGVQHSPRAYLVHHWSDALTIKGGVGRGFKAPHLKQLSPDYEMRSTTFAIYGNPDLKPEISTNVELNADYQGQGWSVQGGVFQNSLKDLIQTRCVSDCTGYRILNYVNVDKARIRGTELGGSMDLPWRLKLKGNYTYLSARDLSADRPLAERPSHSANLILSWSANDKLSADLRAKYLGTQTYYNKDVPNTLPAYSLWSIDATYKLDKQLSLRASIENLGNKDLSKASPLFQYAEVGRFYYVGLRANF